MAYVIHTHFGDAVTDGFAAALQIRSDFGGHIVESAIDVCPACGTRSPRGQGYLGTLGEVAHYRCRACGSDFTVRGSR